MYENLHIFVKTRRKIVLTLFKTVSGNRGGASRSCILVLFQFYASRSNFYTKKKRERRKLVSGSPTLLQKFSFRPINWSFDDVSTYPSLLQMVFSNNPTGLIYKNVKRFPHSLVLTFQSASLLTTHVLKYSLISYSFSSFFF